MSEYQACDRGYILEFDENQFYGQFVVNPEDEDRTSTERRWDGLMCTKFVVHENGLRTPVFIDFYACNGRIFLAQQDEEMLEPPSNLELYVDHEDEVRTEIIETLQQYFFGHHNRNP